MNSSNDKHKLNNEKNIEDEQSNSSNKMLNINEHDILLINSINNNNEISINLMKEDSNKYIKNNRLENTKALKCQCNYLEENKNIYHKNSLIYCPKCDVIFCSNCENYHLKLENQNHKNIDIKNLFIREEIIDKQNNQILSDLEIFKKNNLDDYLYLEVELKNESDSLLEIKNTIMNIFDNLDKEYQKQLNLLQKASSTQKEKIDKKAQKIEYSLNMIKKYDKSNKFFLLKYFKECIQLNQEFQKDKKKINDFLKSIPKKIINNINRNIVKHKKEALNEISNLIINNSPNIINNDYLSDLNILDMSNNFSCQSLPNSGFLLDNFNINNDKALLGKKRKIIEGKNSKSVIQKENSFSINHIVNSKDKMDKKLIEQLKKVILQNISNINGKKGEKDSKNNILNKEIFQDNSSISSSEQGNILNKKENVYINNLKKDKNTSLKSRPDYLDLESQSIIKSNINMLNNINIINNNNNKIIVDDENFIDFQKDKNELFDNNKINGLKNIFK